ncbi:MAG: hypothetical protein AAGI01_11190, partial [Myxococcota bacterium]
MNTTAKSANVHVVAMVEQIASTEMPPLERAEALIEIALDLQKQPKDPQDLHDALYLYERAAEWTADHRLATARVHAGRGAALRRLPGSGLAELEQARDAFEDALPVLRADGEAEELAEVEMSFGLVLQALAAANRATLPDAIAAYQRALRTFGKHAYPREYAILHNNLATAYLSMKLSPEKDVMREAMAVQSFRQALEVVTLLEDPSEYAMLQNNLGNALQAMRTAHPLENLRRAVEAYDEALKVRTPYDTPVEFANTATNTANALMNLPDDPD